MIQYVFMFYSFTSLEFDSNQPLLDLFIFGFKPALKLSSFTYTKQLVWSFGCLLHFKTARTATHQASLFTSTQSLLKLMSVKSVMPSNHLILCHLLLLLPSIIAKIRAYLNESVLRIRLQSIGVSASASVLPMNILD